MSKNEATCRRGIISVWPGLIGKPSRMTMVWGSAAMILSAGSVQKGQDGLVEVKIEMGELWTIDEL